MGGARLIPGQMRHGQPRSLRRCCQLAGELGGRFHRHRRDGILAISGMNLIDLLRAVVRLIQREQSGRAGGTDANGFSERGREREAPRVVEEGVDVRVNRRRTLYR